MGILLILQHFKEMVKKVADIFQATTLKTTMFQVLTAVLLKTRVFWDVTLCLWMSRCSEEFESLHLQGQVGQEVLLNPEDRSTATLRNIDNCSSDSKGWYPKRL
jgi:hypothetical protein